MSKMINTRENRIEIFSTLRIKLMERFIGIEEEIDSILQLIYNWYVNPELIDRPLIINMWGMTGVGKTDLIRQIVYHLHINNYTEKQMDGSEYGSVRYSLTPDEPGILLLDEFQRFRHKDENGKRIDKIGYQDIWQILSDGNLILRKADIAYNIQKKIRTSTTKVDWVSIVLEVLEYYNIKDFNLLDSVLKKTDAERKKWIFSFIDNQVDNLVVDYTKQCIFICGNLDSVYKMAGRVHEAAIPADFFRKETECISILDIKDNLDSLFYPEHIARLGNNHIIYKAISTDSFVKLIHKRLAHHADRIFIGFNISLIFSNEFCDMIYRNGVYPTQGVRPLFSTIDSIIGSQIIRIITNMVTNNIEYYSNKDAILVDYADDHIIVENLSEQFIGDIDIEWEKTESNKKIMKSVCYHEAGHAVVYYRLTGLYPNYMIRQPTGDGAVLIRSCTNKIEKIDNICVLYGGIESELKYGKIVTWGHADDIRKATHIASDLIRKFEYNDSIGMRLPITDQHSPNTLIIDKKSNRKIENILKSARTKAGKIIDKNKVLIKYLADALYENRVLDENFIKKIIKKYS